MRRRLTARVVTVAAAVLAGVAAGACRGDGSPTAPSSDSPCRGRAVSLLAADLAEWTPSDPFEVRGDHDIWLRVTKKPTSAGGLFGTAGGVAQLYWHEADALPPSRPAATDTAATARSIVVRRPLEWQRIEVGQGTWRLYSLSNPTVEVVSCPR